MSALLSQCEPVIKLLSSTSFTYLKKPILQKARNNLFNCITEICFNLLKSTVVLDEAQENRIKQNRALVSILGTKKFQFPAKESIC